MLRVRNNHIFSRMTEDRMNKPTIFLTILIAMAVTIVACDSEIDDQPAAVVSEAQAEVDDDDDGQSQNMELAMDSERSSIGWVGAKVTGDHVGGFNDWTGNARIRDGEISGLDFTVDTRSIYSDNDDLTGHLMSDDFFDVEAYPEATFRSTKIEQKASEHGTHEVTGNFTIRGVTNGVTFPATIELDDDELTATTEFTIQRFDFGIEFKGKPDDLIRDEVLLKIELFAS